MATILYTNDLHGAVGLYPYLAALVARERVLHPDALLLDAGDTGIGGATAELQLRLLRAFSYDALTTGNAENEVLEYRENLRRIGAPIAVANVPSAALGGPSISHLIRDVGGIRLAILGLTVPPVYPLGHPLHRHRAQEVPVDDPVAAASHWVPTLHKQADVVVVLSHLGLWRDVELASQVPGISVIVGGHSHHRLASLLHVGDTAISHAGVGAAYLGGIQLDRSGGQCEISGHLEPTWQDIREDAGAREMVTTYLAERMPQMLEIVGETDGCWADPWTENRWSNFVCDVLREEASADICFFNALALRPALDAGSVAVWDLLRCMPGVMLDRSMGLDGLVRMTLSGAAVRAICEQSVSALASDIVGRATDELCQPGPCLLHVSGLEVAYDLQRPEGERITRLSVGGNGLAPGREYTVATSSFLAKGYSGFEWFRSGDGRQMLGLELDILARALHTNRSLPDVDGRLRFTST